MSAIEVTSFADDLLELKPFAERLERFIAVERLFVDGGLVVSLDAPFGFGKTTFLKMWSTDLEARALKDPMQPRPIVLNAWESDFCGDPLLAIVSGLVHAVEQRKGAGKDQGASRIRDAAKDAAWFATGLANSFVANWSGIDVVEAGKLAEEKGAAAKKPKPDILQTYEDRVRSVAELRKVLAGEFGGENGRALILVDELDRCRPDYAISYLETIKHVFNVPGLVFLLAVDFKRLSDSAEAVFGALNVDEYFRKFVHRKFSMPVPDEAGLRKVAAAYTKAFLERENVRVSLLKLDENTVENFTTLVGGFQLTLRQIQSVFRIVGHVLTGDAERRGRIYWCIGVGVMFMTVLKIGSPEAYNAIGRRTLSPLDLGRLLISKLGQNHAEWWFTLYLTGLGSPQPPEKEIDVSALFAELGFIEQGAQIDKRQRFGAMSQGWGHAYASRIHEIFEKIERVETY